MKQEKDKKKKNKFLLYLGENKFFDGLFKYYSWFFPVAILIFSLPFLYDGAFVTGLLLLLLGAFNLPPLKKITVKIPRILRILINLGLIAGVVFSITLYIK